MTRDATLPLRKTRALSSAEVESELVMMDLARNRYFGLNRTAATIWTLLDEAISPNDICQRLLQRFTVDEADCRADLNRFLDQLEAAELIEVCTQ